MIIKICGIKNQDTLSFCEKNNVNYFGMIFYKNSPRNISFESAKKLQNMSKKFKINGVGVFVNESVNNLKQYINYLGLKFIQLHGEEDDSFCRKFSDEYKIIRATGIKDDDSVKRAKNILIETVLLDAYCGNDFGGLGHTFEWEYAKMFKLENPERPIFLPEDCAPRMFLEQ